MSQRGGNGMGRFSVDVDLTNNEDLVQAKHKRIPKDQVRHERVPGVVDPGASYLVLSKAIADKLGVPAAGKARVRYADGRKAMRHVVDQVRLELLGRQGTFKAIVEPNRKDVLVGAIVLEDLDLLVDCRMQKLVPRDPHQIIAEIE